MFMIKSNLGSGYVRNVVFDQFIAQDTAYGLDINQYWSSQSPGTGAGVQLSNITFSVRITLCLPPRTSTLTPLPLTHRRTGMATLQTACSARLCSSSVPTARRAMTSRSRT